MNKREYKEFCEAYTKFEENAIKAFIAKSDIHNKTVGECGQPKINYTGDITVESFDDITIEIVVEDSWKCGGYSKERFSIAAEFMYDTENALKAYEVSCNEYVESYNAKKAAEQQKAEAKEREMYLKLKEKFES